MSTDDLLAQEREKIFQLLQQAQGLYNSPEASTLLAQLQGRASGEVVPFDNQVTSAMYAANADASAGRVAGEQDMIRQAFSNAGLGGSGLQAQAMVQSRRRANAATRTGRREITSRAQLENYQAKERAQQQVQNYLAQKNAQIQQAMFQEADYRAKQHATGDATNVAQATGGDTQGQAPGQTAAAPAVDPQIAAMRERFMGANPFSNYLGRPNEAAYGFGQAYNPTAATRYANDVKQWEAGKALQDRKAQDWENQRQLFFAQHGF